MNSYLTTEHSYEELREIVISVMLDTGNNGVDKFDKLLRRLRLNFISRTDPHREPQQFLERSGHSKLNANDAELVLDIVWDLFRQGIVTLGANAGNPGVAMAAAQPLRKERALQQSPYRVHNKAGFVKALRSEVTDISPEAVVYYREAVAAFYMDCLLSTCVMLSIAAESEFL